MLLLLLRLRHMGHTSLLNNLPLKASTQPWLDRAARRMQTFKIEINRTTSIYFVSSTTCGGLADPTKNGSQLWSILLAHVTTQQFHFLIWHRTLNNGVRLFSEFALLKIFCA